MCIKYVIYHFGDASFCFDTVRGEHYKFLLRMLAEVQGDKPVEEVLLDSTHLNFICLKGIFFTL